MGYEFAEAGIVENEHAAKGLIEINLKSYPVFKGEINMGYAEFANSD